LSSVIAAWTDAGDALASGAPVVSGDPSVARGVVWNLNIGYFWKLVNGTTGAAYVLTLRKRIRSTGFSDWDSMSYNSLLSIPDLAIFSILFEDWSTENLVKNFPPGTRNFLLSAVAFSGVAAIGISYTTAWCVCVTSSTTYSIVGALSKLPVAASGMIFFGDAVTFGSASAVSVGFFAEMVYALAKNNARVESARPGIVPRANGKT